ncbi:hypothetical protein [Pikeienuella sp. HZG-20]|uniref:hypothetical protein n=1 Tax=Paludibacillus litoralis TaxID=3133267 RepID=UPI0030EC9AB9
MTTTTISKTGDAEVTLKADDPYTGEDICRVFSIPASGGYVRDANGAQVCVGLERLGHTLEASDGDDLLRVIRKNWATARRNAAKHR